MESLARDFAELDRTKCQNVKLRRFDRFGTMLGFHIRGSYKFQTKVGAVVSLIYIAAIVGFLVYYLTKFFETTNPVILWNVYDSDTYSDTKLSEGKIHFYFTPYNLNSKSFIPYNQFLANFSLWVTVNKRDLSKPMNAGGLQWFPVALKPCAGESWINEINNTSGMLTIKNWGICLDYKDVHIFTPNLANKQSVNMSLYQCQPGSGVTCVNQIPPAIVLHNFFVFQSTINVKRYSNPSAKISLQLEMVQLDDTLKYETNYNINDTILQTDQGAVFEDFKNETFPIVEKKDFIVYMRSSQKIGGSFASHGRMPNQDYFWQVKIHAGNKTTEIVRTYFTMIHVLSALGGQIYT